MSKWLRRQFQKSGRASLSSELKYSEGSPRRPLVEMSFLESNALPPTALRR